MTDCLGLSYDGTTIGFVVCVLEYALRHEASPIFEASSTQVGAAMAGSTRRIGTSYR